MAGLRSLVVFSSILQLPLSLCGNFDPFVDQTMFLIDWKGPLPLESSAEEVASKTDNVVVMTRNKEQYKCIMPEVYDSRKQQENADNYHGPSASELMDTLFQQTSCSYRLESYWTYELCHGRHLRQYHETKEQGKKPKVQEYILGFGRDILSPHTVEEAESQDAQGEDQTPPTKDSNIKYRRIDGIDLPYYEVVMTGGTPCDLTNDHRKTRVLYVCQPDGHGEVYELKETSTCEYEVMVLTSVLCAHPLFRPKNPPVNKISCHSMSGASHKPQQLQLWEDEAARLQSMGQQEILFGVPEDPYAQGTPVQPSPVPTPPTERKVPRVITSTTPHAQGSQSALSHLTDKQVLRDLLSGDYCLQGGSGWWKHEVCLGRYARQFHRDRTGETAILLGSFNEEKHLQWLEENPNKKPKPVGQRNFNEEKHLQWLEENPNKKPKPVGQRKFLNYYYSGGDVCDMTGRPRSVEIRLKCAPNSQNPHAVSLFLSEPATCEYVLVVESAMLCDLMDQADEFALLHNVNL
ncbi:hypothetical protein BaRGS_00001687 [Batillaria attramentaria]|uniref:Endoplasmic reticulum lectin 1 n=1 Tax=Batillaria attramentaria TaxID=370345 RepID=A0ABD0M654_9CAEN